MFSIKHFLKLPDPQIHIKYYRTEQETENEKIYHEFVGFDASDAEISSISAAKALARKMGAKVLPALENLSRNTKEKDRADKISKTEAWVYKKAVWHPAMVEKSTHKVLQMMRLTNALDSLPLSYKEIYADASIAAILHDIGRLSEVDIKQGSVCIKGEGFGKNHAEISFDILEHAKIKPEILLAIKYHYFADISEAINDEIYKGLSADNKKIAEFYVRLLQDMDKTGNLFERAKNGAKKSSEYFISSFKKDYDITEEYYDIAMSGKYLPVKEGHLLDVMIHYITWGYEAHYKETKELLASILSDIFLRIYEEIDEEYNHSQDKNKMKLLNTLERMTRLEDYAITERTGLKINTKNRRKINKEIGKLRKEVG